MGLGFKTSICLYVRLSIHMIIRCTGRTATRKPDETVGGTTYYVQDNKSQSHKHNIDSNTNLAYRWKKESNLSRPKTYSNSVTLTRATSSTHHRSVLGDSVIICPRNSVPRIHVSIHTHCDTLLFGAVELCSRLVDTLLETWLRYALEEFLGIRHRYLIANLFHHSFPLRTSQWSRRWRRRRKIHRGDNPGDDATHPDYENGRPICARADPV